jgi:dTDP-4-dehydrorhamnose 3,5-epimerase-like enzyme
MAYFIDLPTFSDERGDITVLENTLSFNIKRVYYVYNTNEKDRGGHRHKKTIQATICIIGSCEIYCNDGVTETVYLLDSPAKCLIIETKDWHVMKNFRNNAVLLVAASECYDPDDYIYTPREAS